MANRNKMFVGMLFGVCLILISQDCMAIRFQQNAYPNGELLVSADHLEALKNEEGLVIIDARSSGYETAHIPGAISIPLHTLDTTTPEGGIYSLDPPGRRYAARSCHTPGRN